MLQAGASDAPGTPLAIAAIVAIRPRVRLVIGWQQGRGRGLAVAQHAVTGDIVLQDLQRVGAQARQADELELQLDKLVVDACKEHMPSFGVPPQ